MPLYEFRCPECGPFERHRAMAQASTPVPCPTCSGPAPRVYTPLRALIGRGSGAGADRLDRAVSGEPVITGRPTGRRLPRTAHRH